MIDNRRGEIVRKNLTQITGVNRSDKFVHRLAGQSSDTERKSQTEQLVIWYGAAAIENPLLVNQIETFWKPLFEYSRNAPRIYRLREFWAVEDEINSLLSQMRRARIVGDANETRRAVVKIEQALKEISQILDGEVSMTEFARI